MNAKAKKETFPVWPQFDRKTDARVLNILHSGRVNYWTGPVGMQFESEWAHWLGVRHAVSVSTGDAALHVALTALGIGKGDEVICTASPFVPPFPSGWLSGATPVMCERGVDRLIDPRRIASHVTRQTRAILVSHGCGGVADLAPILRLAQRRGLAVLEDCTQGFGGLYKGRKTGSVGTVGIFSFGASSSFSTAGAGGMVCCDDDDLAWEMRSIRDQGYDVRAKRDLLLKEGRSVYVHRRLGYNFRMTEIQSAVGLGELRRLDLWNLPHRRRVATALMRRLAGHPLIVQPPVDTSERRNGFCAAPFVLDAASLGGAVPPFVERVRREGASVQTRTDDVIAFWTHPVYRCADVEADVRAFERAYAAWTGKRGFRG